METTPPIHHIFIDFENTQAVDLSLLHNQPARVTLLVGDKQKSLPVLLVQQLLQYHAKVRLIETAASGKNALDFILAFHLGQIARLENRGHFYIISKDKGYDALIKHMKENGFTAIRQDEFAEIPIFKKVTTPVVLPSPTPLVLPAKAPEPVKPNLVTNVVQQASEPMSLVLERLRKHNTSRPGKRETLTSYIKASFKNQLPEIDANKLVQQLVQRKLIGITAENKVQYHF